MRACNRDPLIVAVGAGMIVGPGNRGVEYIVRNMPRSVGLWIFGVKEMRTADTAEGAQRGTEVFMVSRRHDAAATLAEPSYALTVCDGETVSHINCKKPQLVKVCRIQRAKDRIVA